MCHFAVQMHYARAFVLALDEQCVRLYYCRSSYACVFEFEGVVVWHSMATVWGRNFIPMRCVVVQIHYNGDWRLWIDLRFFIYGTGVVMLAVNEQRVRLYCCARLNLKVLSLVSDAVLGRNFTIIMCCPNTLQWRWRLCVDLCWLNVWNVRRVVGWP